MKRPIDSRQLRYFLAVADEGHIGRAADRLNISQPPMTRHIQALEARMSTALLTRHSRGITLTRAGEALRDEARRLLSSLDRVEDHVRSVAEGESGRIRIGFVSTALYTVLPQLIRSFRQRWPAIRIDLVEQTLETQSDALQRSEIDVGFALCVPESAGLSVRCLLHEPLIACLPDEDRWKRDEIELSDLKNEPFVMFPRESAPVLHDRIMGYAEHQGFSIRIDQTAVQMQTIIGLVSAGLGVALVPRSMGALARPGVNYCALGADAPEVETQIIWSKDSPNPAVASFTQYALDSANYLHNQQLDRRATTAE